MFNWFKSKVELKNDKSIMSSFYSKGGVKLGSELIVPQNFKALIYYNEKLYYTLDAGKHKVDASSMASLIDAHKNRKKKLKNVKLVCHYINTSLQNIEISLKKQKYIANFYIDNVNKFADLMLLYSFKVDNNYVYCNLHSIFSELLVHHNYDYIKINKTSLIDYGIIIESLYLDGKSPSIFNSKNNILHENNATAQQSITSNITQSDNNSQPNISIEQNMEKSNITNEISDTTHAQVCPKCKNIAKFNTTYCLKCGFRLD